jgi:hypothetical protein
MTRATKRASCCGRGMVLVVDQNVSNVDLNVSNVDQMDQMDQMDQNASWRSWNTLLGSRESSATSLCTIADYQGQALVHGGCQQYSAQTSRPRF